MSTKIVNYKIFIKIEQRKDYNMKRHRNGLLILGIGLFISFGHAQMKDMDHKQHSDSTHLMNMKQTMDKEDGGEEIAYYTCLMEAHKHIHSSSPGECP